MKHEYVIPAFRYITNLSTPSTSIESVDLPDTDSARNNAVVITGDMLAKIDGEFWEDSEWQLDVTDERGLILCSIVVLGIASAAGQAPKERTDE
jgi:hypothetical protein